MRRDPRVSLAVIDPDNPYRYLEIRGTRSRDHRRRRRRSHRQDGREYLGVDKYPTGQPGEVRVLYKIKPEHTTVMGSIYCWSSVYGDSRLSAVRQPGLRPFQ